MRKGIEHWLNQVWYGRKKPPFWLVALVPLYRFARKTDRRWKIARQPEELRQVPIIVVGNLTVGGSGKTPLVVHLCNSLQQAGFKPGVVSRGYGRKTGALTRVGKNSSPADVGDEPVLIARRTGVPVMVANDRCAAALSLLKEDVDVVIADDGLQHYRLPRTLEICVVDGAREFGNGLELPAGPLRESVERLKSVDYVVVNGGNEAASAGQRTINMQIVPGLLRSLDDRLSWRISQFTGCQVNAIAGIGNPQRFFQSLQQAGLKTHDYAFPDHHVFTDQDFSAMKPDLPIIMTEKDAVKCAALQLDNAWYLSVDAMLPTWWDAEIAEKVSVTRRAAGHS